MAANKRVPLSREDWAAAALTALADSGLAGIAVEPLAARLGATKGSFYWHFRDRGALVDAALELWEKADTEGVIAMLEQLPEPLARMRALFALTHPADSRFGVEAVLLAEADDPQISPVLRRVTARRVSYMVDTLQELGLPEREARHRALLAYQTWIGYMQLQRAAPNVMPRGSGREEYLQHVLTVIEGGLHRDGDGDSGRKAAKALQRAKPQSAKPQSAKPQPEEPQSVEPRQRAKPQPAKPQPAKPQPAKPQPEELQSVAPRQRAKPPRN